LGPVNLLPNEGADLDLLVEPPAGQGIVLCGQSEPRVDQPFKPRYVAADFIELFSAE